MEQQPSRHESWTQPRLGDERFDIDNMVIAALQEQSDRYAAERDKLRHEATYDQLTGLLRHRVWKEEMEAHLQAGRTIAVFFLDIDQFKGVNDRYGHDEGDDLLVTIGQKLRRAFGRKSDALSALKSRASVARRSGDEIYVGIVLDSDSPDAPRGQDRRTADIAAATEYAFRSIALIEAGLTDKLRALGVGISVGVAISDPDHFESLGELLKLAEQNMYRHKQAKGTGRIVITPAGVIRPRTPTEDSTGTALRTSEQDAA